MSKNTLEVTSATLFPRDLKPGRKVVIFIHGKKDKLSNSDLNEFNLTAGRQTISVNKNFLCIGHLEPSCFPAQISHDNTTQSETRVYIPFERIIVIVVSDMTKNKEIVWFFPRLHSCSARWEVTHLPRKRSFCKIFRKFYPQIEKLRD